MRRWIFKKFPTLKKRLESQCNLSGRRSTLPADGGYNNDVMNSLHILICFQASTVTPDEVNPGEVRRHSEDLQGSGRGNLHRRMRMKYLSERCPEIRDPKRYPTKRVDEAKGTFHSSPQTRSH